MSVSLFIAIALGVLMLVGFVALTLLWALTEEMPRLEEVPFYERMEAGTWGVRLLRVGRRQMRALRLINEALGGDLGAAKYLIEHPPGTIIEGISEPLAREMAAALAAAGAEVELFEG